jgi:hypothetical protein
MHLGTWILGPVVVAMALGPGAEQRQNRVRLEGADCSRTNMMFGDFEVARAEQQVTVAPSGVLDVQPESNGGVKIIKGNGPNYVITACIAAGAATMAEAQGLADAVRLSAAANKVRVENVRGARSWSVQLIVEAPDGAQIDAQTNNGPIGIEGVTATINARASNGPISLDDVKGQVSARAANGPISVEGSRGEFDLETQNGPITVALLGSRWDGHLTARAQNGPLSLRVPANYASGVEVTSSRHSPWSCRAAACGEASRGWDNGPRTFRVGPEPVVVRISTVNGPVTISDAGR